MGDGGAGQPAYSSNEAMLRSNPVLFVGLVLLVPVFGIGLVGLAIWYVMSKSVHLEIARGEVMFTRGLLSRDTVAFPISAVRTVTVSQTLLERWTGAGTVSITTAGDTPEVVAKGMPDVLAIKRILKGPSVS